MKWHPDGLILAAGTEENTVAVWDVKQQATVATLTGHEGAVQALSFSNNGYYLATGSKDGTVKIWDLRKPLNIQTLQISESPVHAVAFDQTGQYLSIGAESVQVYNFEKKNSLGETVKLQQHGGAVMGVCFARHAGTLASVSMDRTLKLYRKK
jgi:pre-mRNA-processing factor 19